MKPRIFKDDGMNDWTVETQHRRVLCGSWRSAIRWALWYCDVNAGVV